MSLKLVYFGVYSFLPKFYIFYLIGCERKKSRNNYFKVYVFVFSMVKEGCANAYLSGPRNQLIEESCCRIFSVYWIIWWFQEYILTFYLIFDFVRTLEFLS